MTPDERPTSQHKEKRCQPVWGSCELREGHRGMHWNGGTPSKIEHAYKLTPGRRDTCSALIPDRMEADFMEPCGDRKMNHREASR